MPSVAVVCGGPSAEAEVSRESGRCVANALRAAGVKATIFELDAQIAETLQTSNVDVVFPALHGPPGEDGRFQGVLEILGLPYVGSGVAACACAMDKALAKCIFRSFGLPLARDLLVHRREEATNAAQRVVDALGTHVVVKPSNQGSALGVLFATSLEDIQRALEQAFLTHEQVLVEEYIQGREITAGILERNGIEALPVIEIRTPSGTWYDYQHRYTPALSEHIVPAPLPQEQYQRVQEVAKLAHGILGCRDLSRADFVVPRDAEPVLLEVNTLPGMTPTSLYPDAARHMGLSFENLTLHLVERALSRAQKEKK